MKNKSTTNSNLKEESKKVNRTLKSLVDASKTTMSRASSIIPLTALYDNVSPKNTPIRDKREITQPIDYTQGMIDWTKSRSKTNRFDVTYAGKQPLFNFGNALLTDGVDDEVQFSAISEISSASKYSISTWIKVSSGDIALIGRESVTGDRLMFTKFSNDQVFFIVANGTASFGRFTFTLHDTWVHLVGVFDGTQTGNANRLKIYLNGVEQTLTFTGTIPATTPVTATGFKINNGTLVGIGESFYDETALFSDALTAWDVSLLYNSGNGASAEAATQFTPFAYWRFNEVDGELTLTDEMGNYDGTLSNFSTPPAYFVEH